MNKPTKIILIHGLMRSGKDTLGDMIKKELIVRTECETVTTIQFASALKNDCVAHIQPILEEINKVLFPTINLMKTQGLDTTQLEALTTKPDNWYEHKTILTRMFLQKIGTEFCRAIDPDIWAHRFITSVSALGAYTTPKYVVCTDLRFENEAYLDEYLTKEERTLVDIVRIKIVRNNAIASGVSGHASESGLPDNMFDCVVENNYDLTVLADCASTVVDYMLGELDDNVVHTINDDGELQPLLLPINYTHKLTPP